MDECLVWRGSRWQECPPHHSSTCSRQCQHSLCMKVRNGPWHRTRYGLGVASTIISWQSWRTGLTSYEADMAMPSRVNVKDRSDKSAANHRRSRCRDHQRLVTTVQRWQQGVHALSQIKTYSDKGASSSNEVFSPTLLPQASLSQRSSSSSLWTRRQQLLLTPTTITHSSTLKAYP